MTRDDIIRMARKCSFGWAAPGRGPVLMSEEQIERFAALVAEAEREACAEKVRGFFAAAQFDRRHRGFDDVRVTIGDVNDLADSICKNPLEIGTVKNSLIADEAVAAEREACAKVCEDGINSEQYPTLTEIAAAIRARGQA